MSSQSIVLLIMGVCGSGKTLFGQTLASRLGFSFADADNYHSEANKNKLQAGIALNDDDRLPWLVDLSNLIKGWQISGCNGVLACSALREKYRQILITDPDRTYVLFLDGTYELFSKRLAARNHAFMNAELLASQLETLEAPKTAVWLDAGLSLLELTELACRAVKAEETKKGRQLLI